MKVLIIQPWISYRGAETVSVNQCYYLEKLGHTAKIAAIFVDWRRLPQHGKEVGYLLPPKILSNLCQNSRFFLFFLGPWLLFFVILRHINRFEVLNPHNLPSVWIASFLGRLFRKKVVWTVHTVPKSVFWKNKKSIFEYFVWLLGASALDNWAVSQVDLILAVSKSIKDQVQMRYKKDAAVLYSGISDLKKGKFDPPKKLINLRKRSKLLLLTVGVLNSQKRQKLLIDALKKIHIFEPTASLVLVGDGRERRYLEKYAGENKLQDFVFFAGFVSQNNLVPYYVSCDLHLMPSIGESFGGAAFEALSLGKLSIVSQDNGANEVLKKYVLICESTAKAISDKVKIFVSKRREYRQKALKGKIYIQKKLNWNNYIHDFISLVNRSHKREIVSSVYSKEYYEIHYEKEHKALQKEREQRLARAIELLAVKKGMKILDLGCGNGELCLRLARMGAEVYGIDYSRDGIMLAKELIKSAQEKERKRIHLYQMDAGKLSFPNNFFDRVVSLDVFEHIYPEVLQNVINEIVRVMKPKGKLVIETAPNLFFLGPVSFFAKKILGWEKFESDEYHINIFDYFRFKRTLQQVPGKVSVSVLNDSHEYFSSRLWGVKKAPSWIKGIARFVDFLYENPIVEPIILNTPLQIFFAHDLWGVVEVDKK